MTKIIGRLDSVGIGKETVRGTAVAATYWIPWMELDMESKVETVNDETSLARLESSDGMAVVSKYGEITIKTKVKDKHIGLLFLSILGTDTPALVETGVYDHVFSVMQSTQHPSLSVCHKNANEDERFANAVVDSMKIEAELGNYVMYEASLMAKAGAAGSNTVAHSQENDFVPQNISFKKATTQAGLDAAQAVSIRNFSIEIKSNILREDVLGSVDPNDIVNQAFDISGTVTLVHNDTTFSALQNAETYQALRFKLEHTATIGAASKPTITIDLHRARITNYNRKRALNDLLEESFDFTAHYNLTDSKMVTLTLRNTVATY